MATEGQKFIRRNRAPRVHITYEDPYDAERLVELPFVMGVMADLSGDNGEARPAIEDRKFSSFDTESFDEKLAQIPNFQVALRHARELIAEWVAKGDAVDEVVRKKIASLKRGVVEGSAEWNILHRRYREEELRKKGPPR